MVSLHAEASSGKIPNAVIGDIAICNFVDEDYRELRGNSALLALKLFCSENEIKNLDFTIFVLAKIYSANASVSKTCTFAICTSLF